MITRRKRVPKTPVGARPRSVMFNFMGGLAAWPQALARGLGDDNLWLNARARALHRLDAGWELIVERNGLITPVRASTVVLAAPAYVAADLRCCWVFCS